MSRNNHNAFPARHHSGGGGDSYRPPPPPPSLPPPPPPPGQPPPRWGESSYRGGPERRYPRPPQGDFTFRMEKPAAIRDVDDSYDNYRPGQDRPRHKPRNAPNRSYPRRVAKPHASDRMLLTTSHERTDVDYADEEGGVKYRDLDDLSDSDEAEMEISSSGSLTDQEGPATKKRRLSRPHTPPAVQNSKPKWSNPDPYTALPCPDESRRRKDVVQLIRKARVEGSGENKGVIEEETDFISFDDEGDRQKHLNVAEDGIQLAGLAGEAGEASRLSFTSAFTSAPPQHRLADEPSFSDFRTNLMDSHKSSNLTHKTSNLSSLPPLPPSLPPRPSFTAINPSNPIPTDNQDGHSLATAIDLTTTTTSNLIPSDDLGSRKRTADDEIKSFTSPPEVPILESLDRGMPLSGDVVAKWQPKPNQHATPWLKRDQNLSVPSSSSHMLQRELMAIYNYLKPQEHEQLVREELVHRLRRFCAHHWRGSDVQSFGSFQTGLYLPSGDMDLVLLSSNSDSTNPSNMRNMCYRFAGVVKKVEGMAVAGSVQAIARAKVPIVKYQDLKTGLQVDVSFDKIDGVKAIDTLKAWQARYPVLSPLIILVKHFLTMRGLSEPATGGIGGLSVTCLIVAMLQRDPDCQTGLVGLERLGELFLRFMVFYGHEFDYTTAAIMTDPQEFCRKEDLNFPYSPDKKRKFCIIDPNNNSNDIAGGSTCTPTIVREFHRACRSIVAQLEPIERRIATRNLSSEDIGRVSLLSEVFGGNYENNFDAYRKRLLYNYKTCPEKFLNPAQYSSPPRVMQRRNQQGGQQGNQQRRSKQQSQQNQTGTWDKRTNRGGGHGGRGGNGGNRAGSGQQATGSGSNTRNQNKAPNDANNNQTGGRHRQGGGGNNQGGGGKNHGGRGNSQGSSNRRGRKGGHSRDDDA